MKKPIMALAVLAFVAAMFAAALPGCDHVDYAGPPAELEVIELTADVGPVPLTEEQFAALQAYLRAKKADPNTPIPAALTDGPNPVFPKTTCGNVACGVADCQCGPDACRCIELGQCLPAPVQQVSQTQPVSFPTAREILDTSRPPQACRRNADGSWSCGPQSSRSSAGRSSGVCAPQRTGPVRAIVRRLFSGS